MKSNLWATVLACSLYAQVVEESFFRDPGPLDFIAGEGLEQFILQSMTGDSLVGVDAQSRVVPRLASQWKVHKDRLRVKLRTGVTFSDGRPLTFADVEWTLREIQRDAAASPTKRALLQGLALQERDGWIEFQSPKPPQRLLLELARVPIAARGNRSVGTGPYLLERQGSEWRFKARSHFLAPKIPEFHFRLVGDDQAMLQHLQKGWLSVGVPPARAGLRPPPSHQRWVQPTHAQVIVWSKGGVGPLQGLERWRAEAYPADFFGDKARPSRGLWPETLGFKPLPIQAPPWSPPAGTSLELIYPSGDELVQTALLAIRTRAQKDGVKLEPKPVEPALLYERLQKGQFQLACATVLFDPHPWAVLEYMEAEGPMNFAGWASPRLAALLPKLRVPDAPGWKELQRNWAQSPAALPILDLQSVVWIDQRLRVTPSPLGLYLTTPGAAGWTWTP